MSNIIKACSFAAEKHKDQRRKDENKTPYINHPLDVAKILTLCGVKDEEVLIAAVLHDTIEDTKTFLDELKLTFGSLVANIVNECTDDKLLNKILRKKLQISHASSLTKEAKLVKLADKYSNMKDLINSPPKDWKEEEINGYFIWSYEVCKKCFGVNKTLDELLKTLFEQKGITKMTEKEISEGLEKYYSLIDKSE